MSILVLVAIALQAFCGVGRGGAAICLGGGHEHAPDEIVEQCASACDHADGTSLPLPTDRHDGCDCHDVELAFADLHAVRTGSDQCAAPPAPAICRIAPDVSFQGTRRSYSPASSCASHLRHRFDVVRATRLII